MPTFHLLIKGKVQGVFYRVSARETAVKTGVKGWIRNSPEGDVEAVVTGTEEELSQFIFWCKKGPPGSKVTEVIAEELEEVQFIEFCIRR
jgi:acylphosphatase